MKKYKIVAFSYSCVMVSKSSFTDCAQRVVSFARASRAPRDLSATCAVRYFGIEQATARKCWPNSSRKGSQAFS